MDTNQRRSVLEPGHLASGFLIAYKPTVCLAVAVLLVAAASCLLVAKDRRTVTVPEQTAESERAA